MKKCILLVLSLPLALPAQQTVRLRVESRASMITEMPGMKAKLQAMADKFGEDLGEIGEMGSPKENITTSFALVTLTRHDSAGGTVWRAVVDSSAMDQGKVFETLRTMGAPMPRSSTGRSFSILVGDSANRLVQGEPQLGHTAQLDELSQSVASLFEKLPVVAAGVTRVDSSFTESTLPSMGMPVRTAVKNVNTLRAIGADTLERTVRMQTQSDMGSTRGQVFATSTATTRQVRGRDAIPVSRIITTVSTNLTMVPMSGATLTQGTEVRTITRLP